MKLASTLVVSLLDKFTGPSGMVGRSMKGLAGASRALDASLASSRTKLAGYHSNMFGVAAAGYAAARALAAPVTAGIDFETMLENIGQKTGLSGDSLIKLGKTIRLIGRDTNKTASEIGGAIDFLTGMGASAEAAAEMAMPIGKASTAYLAAAEDLSKASFAAYDNLKVPLAEIPLALDMMAQAGKEGGFELKDMANEFPQLTAAAVTLGMKGTKSVADLAAALEVARKGTATGAEAANNMANFMQKIVSRDTVKNMKKFGINVTKELAYANKKGISPIEHMLGLINKASKGGRADLLAQLFGDKQVLDFIRPMLANMEEYKRIRSSALSAQGVIEEDYQRRLKTTGAILRRFRNTIDSMSISIGTALLPAVSLLADKIGFLAARVADFAEAHPVLVQNVVLASAALVGFRLAAYTAGYAVTSLKVAALSSAVAIRGVGRAAIFAGSIGLAPFGRALAGLAGVVQIAAMRFRFGAAALRSGGSAAGFLAGTFATLGRSLLSVGGIAMRLVGSMLAFSGIGLVAAGAIGAIAAAGVWLYNNLSGIVTFLGSFGEAFMAALGPAKGVIQPVVDAAGRLYDKVASWLGPIDASGEKWKAWGELAGKAVAGWVNAATGFVTDTIDLVTSLPDRVMALAGRMYDAGTALVTGLWDGLKAQIDAMLNWFSAKIDGLAASASSLANKISFGMVGTAAPTAPTPPLAGARAAGGPVEFGKIYKVGERGTELFTPGADGYISPNSDYRRATGGSGGRAIHVGGITINLGMVNDGRSVRDIAEELGWRIRDALDGAFADGTV